eukprot:2185674-Rhodomonas_salina.1
MASAFLNRCPTLDLSSQTDNSSPNMEPVANEGTHASEESAKAEEIRGHSWGKDLAPPPPVCSAGPTDLMHQP